MYFEVDTHTHSVSSGHAYSTVQEMAREAYLNGIKMFALTDHGPAMPGAPALYHFGNLKAIPEFLYNVRVLKGAEANIIDYSGGLDIPEGYLKRLDFVMAGFHEICILPSTKREHTEAMINALKNPYVDAVSHPGNPQFEVDIERVVATAKEFGKLIEINNHSFIVRTGSEKNCKNFALECKRAGVKIVCGSDAHISFDVGKFNKVDELLQGIDMPEELVMNTSIQKLYEYLEIKNKRIKNLTAKV
ncbi:MAG: phosphatase [Clostridiaceae bacterium]|nr:phosphatase [Clostridiaceae bacterium]